MQDFDVAAPVAGVCPICQSRHDESDLFCPRCGNFLRGDNSSPEALNLPVVHLLTQVCSLQRELLRQFRTGQAIQSRQFQRALQSQADQLEKTLAHAARQTKAQETRLRLWLRWTVAVAASVIVLAVVAAQLVG